MKIGITVKGGHRFKEIRNTTVQEGHFQCHREIKTYKKRKRKHSLRRQNVNMKQVMTSALKDRLETSK